MNGKDAFIEYAARVPAEYEGRIQDAASLAGARPGEEIGTDWNKRFVDALAIGGLALASPYNPQWPDYYMMAPWPISGQDPEWPRLSWVVWEKDK